MENMLNIKCNSMYAKQVHSLSGLLPKQNMGR